MISVAGGWAGGKISSDNIFQTLKEMYDSSVLTSFFAGYMSSKYLKEVCSYFAELFF